VTSFLQIMRWTGLAPIDVMTLRRSHVTLNEKVNLYQIKRKRNKSGTDVMVPFSREVGDQLMSVERVSDVYFFWSGNGKPQSAISNWGQRYIAPVFQAAGIESTGNMLSYRLRDTFAVTLLENDATMEDVAQLLGNTLKVCEKHYGKWSEERQKKVNAIITRTLDALANSSSAYAPRPSTRCAD
jgi:integrase/recombinase XerD